MKNQKGVSLVTLVITIVVILILSAVTFVASLQTIEKTSYSKFTSNVSDVSAAFEESAAIVKGKKIMEDKEKYMEQIYDYVARNGESEEDFLHFMIVPKYTIIRDEGQIGMELPEMIVESGTGKKIPVKYATTSQGKIFAWPPLDYDEKFYITAEDTVEHKMQTLIKVGEEEFEIKIDSGDGSLLDWLDEDDIKNPNIPSVTPSGDGSGGSPVDHEHIFFSKTQTDEYFCSEATCVLPKQYYYKCINCAAKGPATYAVGTALGHQWGAETVVKQANCTEKGIIQSKCSICGIFSTLYEPVDPGNHHGTEIEEITKQATCGEPGIKTYKCSACNAVIRTENIIATNHNMDKSIITKQPTCTESGIRTYKCSFCDKEMKTEEIPPVGHSDEIFEITKQAKCTETGTKVYKCVYCNKEMRTEEIPVLGHDYSNFEETKEATCTESGVKSKKCIRCGDTVTEEVGALGHDYGTFVVTKEATCNEKGIMTQTCSRCKDEITEEIPIDTSRHYGREETQQTKEATCTEDGITTKVCSLCKAVIQTQTVSALGHSWSAEQPPRRCYRCGLEEKEIIAIYSEIDGSLSFLATSENYNIGGSYNGKMISEIYMDFAQEHFESNTTPWYSVRKNIRTVSFDTEISPVSTAYWFYEQENLITIENIEKLNTSQVDTMVDMFNGCKSLTSIDVSGFNVSNIDNLSGMFANCLTLREISGLNNWETNQIADMSSMFYKCRELTSLDISNWNTANVTSFKTMFSDDGAGLMKLEQLDISNWDTSSATNMMGMFEGCGQLTSLDLSRWNVNNVTDMSYMFADCENILEINISGWDTSMCQNFNALFNDCAKLVNINANELELNSCTDVGQFFDGCLSLKKIDLSSWDMSTVEVAYDMFNLCYSLEEVTLGTGFRFVNMSSYLPTPDPIYISGADGKWYDTVTEIGYKPEEVPSNKAATYIASVPAKAMAIYTAGNNTLTFIKDKPKNIGTTYNGQTITEVYIDFDKTIYTETMVPWYQYRTSIKTVNVVDTIKPISTAHWFNGFENCGSFEVSKLDTSETTDMSYMFSNAGYNVSTFSITGMNNWNTSLATNMEYMFYCAGFGATTFSMGDISNWNTSSAINMSYMLDGIGYSASTVNIGNLDNWNTSSATNMEGMFSLAGYNATIFNIGDLSNWNTSAVTNMKFMFCGTGYSTSTFNIGDLSNWNTSAVTITEGMFDSTGYKSTTFNIGELNNWNMSSVTDMSQMFRAAGFESTTWSVGDLSNWNTNNVLDMSDMFAYTGSNDTTIDLGNLSTKVVVSGDESYTAWNVANVTNMDNMFKGSSIKELNLGGWDNTKTVSMADMFSECVYLERVTLSNAFTFKGTTSYLPTPNSLYIPSADGNWYDIATSEGYAPSNVPSNKAATYVATADLYIYNVIYQSSTGLELENSTLTKLFGTTNTITPREITGYTTPEAQSVVWDSTTPKTITFIYEPIEYSITIDCNGGTGPSSMSYTIETESFNLETPIREGYTFTGWTGSNGTTPETFISIVKGSIGALSYTANWSVNEYTYEIVFESTSGLTLGNTTETKTFGTTMTITPPDIEGYTKPAAQNVAWDSETPKTIIFTYSPISYSITIDCNGGSGVLNTSYTVESETFTLGIPTREGYTFTGWTGSNGTTPETTITIAHGSVGARNYKANWKASAVAQAIYTASDGALTFIKSSTEYSTGGTYNSKTITAVYTGFEDATTTQYPWVEYNTSIKSVTFKDEIKPKVTACWFYGMKNCSSFNLTNLNTSEVTDMTQMFAYAGNNLTSVSVTGLNEFDTSKVKTMNAMFGGFASSATSVSLDLSNWNVSEVTDFGSMFSGVGTNSTSTVSINLTGWTPLKAQYMNHMFYETGYYASTFKITGLNNWNTSNVRLMQRMFYSAGENSTSWSIGDLSNWNTSNVTQMWEMFKYAGYGATSWSIGDLSSWNTGNVLDMSGMFDSAGGSTTTTWNIGDLSNWNVSKVTDMSSMFCCAGGEAANWYVGKLTNWDTGNVTNMNEMFYAAGCHATKFELDLSNWNVGKVTDMEWMFCGTGQKGTTTWNIGDLSNWNTSKVTTMAHMFNMAGETMATFTLKGIGNWDVSSVTTMENMFNCTGYYATTWSIGDLSNWKTGNVTNMSSMFNSAGYTTKTWSIGNIGSWDVSNVTDMGWMFCWTAYNATTFNPGNLSGWNTGNVTNMYAMFWWSGYNAQTWYVGPIGSWNTSKVTNMQAMFWGAGYSATYTLDLSSWDVSNVTSYSSFNADSMGNRDPNDPNLLISPKIITPWPRLNL